MEKINDQFNSKKEKSRFEQVQIDSKESFFFLIHILLKNQTQNVLTQMLIIIVEMIQLLAVPFNIMVYHFFNHIVC